MWESSSQSKINQHGKKLQRDNYNNNTLLQEIYAIRQNDKKKRNLSKKKKKKKMIIRMDIIWVSMLFL